MSVTQERGLRALVTGAAGFIGSQLVRALCERSYEVIGIDCFREYYPRRAKESNVATWAEGGFAPALVECDVRALTTEHVRDIDVIFHLAGQPGVRKSWGEFNSYLEDNVQATQHLLALASERSTAKFVYASSSSVYGNIGGVPARESSGTRPFSPYGVTKLAAEQLCCAYADNFGLPAVALRYFTVYGPHQRPDMAFHRFLKAALSDQAIGVYGDGSQRRDFTYVDDIVRGTIAASEADLTPGTVINLAGGEVVTLAEVLELVETIIGRPLRVMYRQEHAGDVHATAASTEMAQKCLDWRPQVRLEEGLRAELAWLTGTLVGD